MRKLAVLVLGLAALVLNPVYGCGEKAPVFEYSATELNAAIAGTWSITIEGKTHSFRFTQKQAAVQEPHSSRATSLVGEAHACSTRTLVASASACVDETVMPLMAIALDGYEGRVTAQLRVPGTRFQVAFLEVDLGGTSVYATVNPDGSLRDANSPVRHDRS